MSLKARYWSSYIVIFSLPVICLGAFLFTVTKNSLTEDALTKNTIMLQKISNIVDPQLGQAYKIPLDISLDDSYRNFMMKDNPHEALSIMRYLKNSMLMNTFVEDIYLYFYDDEYLVSSNTTVTLSGFFDILYHYKDWTQEQFERDLNSPVSIVRGEEEVEFLKKRSQKQITFLMPVGYLSGSPYASVLIILRSEQIVNLIDNAGIHKSSDFMIIDEATENLLFSSLDTGFYDEPEFRNLVSSFEQKSRSETADSSAIYVNNGKKYHVAHKYSDSTFLSYIGVTPVAELTASIQQMNIFFIVGLALLTGVIILLIMYFLNRNYNPIKNLKQFSQELIQQNESENLFLQDEVEQIRRCLEYLNSNNINLKKELVDGKDNLKSCILFDLIRGEFMDKIRFESAAARAGMKFPNTLYAIAVIHCRTYKQEMVNQIIKDIESHSEESYIIYAHRHFDNDKLILIVNCEEKHKNRLHSDFQAINNHLMTQYAIRQTVGYSMCYSGICDIPKAFLEASTAVNHRLLRGSCCVISYSECLPTDDVENILQPMEIQQFGKLIRNGDYGGTKKFLDELMLRLQNSQFPIYVVKSICFDVVGELKRAATSIFTIPPSHCDTLDLLEYDTADELFETLNIVCRSICDAVSDMTDEKETSKIGSMISYIENNCKNPDFSTDRMAEAFSQSAPALCQYFKQKTEKTVTDYLVDFRMTRAKELLTNTNYPLTQIAYEVGYYNVSSFIRRFKQMVGCSPGVFREANRQDEL